MDIFKQVTVATMTLEDALYYKGVKVLKYSVSHPVFSSVFFPAAVQRMNAFYRKLAADFLRHIRTSMYRSAVEDYKNSMKNNYPVHVYEAMLEFTLTYNQDCALSLYFERYEYAGGAHGATAIFSQSWSLPAGRQLPLGALFPRNRNYIQDIKHNIKAQIAAEISSGNNYYFDNYLELVDKTFNCSSFYLTPEMLAIYFQQYDIAPYASGTPTFFMPYHALHGRLPKC